MRHRRVEWTIYLWSLMHLMLDYCISINILIFQPFFLNCHCIGIKTPIAFLPAVHLLSLFNQDKVKVVLHLGSPFTQIQMKGAALYSYLPSIEYTVWCLRPLRWYKQAPRCSIASSDWDLVCVRSLNTLCYNGPKVSAHKAWRKESGCVSCKLKLARRWMRMMTTKAHTHTHKTENLLLLFYGFSMETLASEVRTECKMRIATFFLFQHFSQSLASNKFHLQFPKPKKSSVRVSRSFTSRPITSSCPFFAAHRGGEASVSGQMDVQYCVQGRDGALHCHVSPIGLGRLLWPEHRKHWATLPISALRGEGFSIPVNNSRLDNCLLKGESHLSAFQIEDIHQ